MTYYSLLHWPKEGSLLELYAYTSGGEAMESALSKFNEISVENLREKVPPSLPQPVVGNMTLVFKKLYKNLL